MNNNQPYLTNHDRNILRALAGRCRDIADSAANRDLKRRWTALNDLRHEGPPLLMVSPEGAWREIDLMLRPECESELARDWEMSLLRRLYHHDRIQDDTAFDPTFTVMSPFRVSDFGLPFRQTCSNQATGAYHDEPVLKNLDSDLAKLRFRSITRDRPQAESLLNLATKTLGDILTIRSPSTYWWTCGLTSEAIRLLGLENLMLAMYDDPDGLHRLMKFLLEEMLHFTTFFEREGMLNYNNSGDHIGSGSLGYTSELPSREKPVDGPIQLKHLWGFAESQETVGVSPEMFSEFIFPYQLPLLERFGLNYYGCCEAIESRWPSISRIPRLRCISVAPWSDQARCAALLGRSYVYCRKPNPSPVCIGFNEAAIRQEFEETQRHAGSINTVMILKDTHTVENDPSRFGRWVKIGRDLLR